MDSKDNILFCKHCGKKWEYSELGELKALEGETEDKEKIAEIMNALNSLVISDESTAISYEDNGERIFVYYDNGETKTYYFEDNFYVDTATNDHYLIISGMRELRMAVYELIGVEYVDY